MLNPSKSIVLGINWEQNSSACLFIDGFIVGATSEERFSNIKNDETYPINAINWLISEFNIETKDISSIAFISTMWSPTYSLVRHYTNFSIKDYISEQELIWKPRILENKNVNLLSTFKHKIDKAQFPGNLFWEPIINNFSVGLDSVKNLEHIHLGQEIRIKTVVEHLGIEKDKILFIDHHLGHAAYGYFSLNIKYAKTLVLTMDAFGDLRNYSAHLVERTKENVTFKELVSGDNFIIGRLYRYVTLILNMKPNEHEYKVMGLAPYGKNQHALEVLRIFESYQSVDGIKFKDLNMPKDLYFSVKNDLIGHRFDSIASGLQMFSENLIIAWVNNLIEETGIDNIVLSGGVAMNVKVNSMISKLKNVRSLLVPPSPDDSSQSMGAAYASTATLIDKQGKIHFPSNNKPISNAYLGKVYEEDYLHKIAIKFAEKNELLITNDAINEAARMICEGAIIGRFSGGAEFGARALGNRSILADPSNIESVKKINEKIKNRDFWMPFAATIMAEHKDKYIYTDVEEASYFYMTNACNTTPLGSKKLRAAIHPYDGTCRPQILTRIHNPEYWELIKKVGEISGTYALLNTSFNYHGKPIVGDPTDALNLFNDANLDALLIGNLLVYK